MAYILDCVERWGTGEPGHAGFVRVSAGEMRPERSDSCTGPREAAVPWGMGACMGLTRCVHHFPTHKRRRAMCTQFRS